MVLSHQNCYHYYWHCKTTIKIELEIFKKISGNPPVVVLAGRGRRQQMLHPGQLQVDPAVARLQPDPVEELLFLSSLTLRVPGTRLLRRRAAAASAASACAGRGGLNESSRGRIRELKR